MTHDTVTPTIERVGLDDALPARISRSRLRRHTLVRNLLFRPIHLLGVVIILAVTLIALFGPLIAPRPPDVPDYMAMLAPPSARHLLGTDAIGYDVFSRILAGARLSLGTALAILAIALVIGLPLGALSGAAGGWVDEAIMRLTDIFLAFPALILALAIAATLGPGLVSATIALAMAFWPWYARLLRGQVLSLKHADYVQAAQVIGTRPAAIMWRHIFPNALSPIIVELSMDLGYAVLATSSLSFIGLGAQPPSPEWGAMIVAGRDYLRTAWWTEAFPGLALTLTVLGFNLIGDGLRDAFDPRAARGK